MFKITDNQSYLLAKTCPVFGWWLYVRFNWLGSTKHCETFLQNMELARVIWKRWSFFPRLSRSKGRLRLENRVQIKRSQNLPFHWTKNFFSWNRRRKIAYSNKCSLSCESHAYTRVLFWSWISTFFSVRLCRSKRLNFKNLLKILVSIEFKFDKANMTRDYPTYTTWL